MIRMVSKGFLIGLAERLHVLNGGSGSGSKGIRIPHLLFRNHLTDSCLILPGLRASEARPNTCFLEPAFETEPLSGLYRTSITSSIVHSRLTIHN